MKRKLSTMLTMETIEAVVKVRELPVFTIWPILREMYPSHHALDCHHPHYRTTMYAMKALCETGRYGKFTTANNDTVFYVKARCLTPREYDRLYSVDDIPF